MRKPAGTWKAFRVPGWLTWILGPLVVCVLAQAIPAAAASPDYTRERKLYREAIAHLIAGRQTAFNAVRRQLADYPLAPYLDYYALRRRLGALTVTEINRFETEHPDMPVAGELRKDWLGLQAQRQNWRELRAGLPADDRTYSVELQCSATRAELAAGDRENALAAARALWLVGRSQPAACDPLFAALQKAGRITPALTWERLVLALQANEVQLARYLINRLPKADRTVGEVYLASYLDPRRILNTTRYPGDTPRVRQIVKHALVRLAERDPAGALKAWPAYRDGKSWEVDNLYAVERAIWRAQADLGNFPPPGFTTGDATLLTVLATAARGQQEWAQLERFITLMPAVERERIEWRYWLARALESQNKNVTEAQTIYRSIAEERHYYGFLAAGRAGLSPSLAGDVSALGPEVVDAVYHYPNGARGLEFMALGENLNAQREWLFGVDNLGPQAAREMTYAALHKGFPHLGIFLANRAGLLDEVAARFPMAYRSEFEAAAKQSRLPLPLLFAITRQESAFDRRARSVANARGLMQLLPSTARWVADKSRIKRPTEAALYEPRTNIRLGSSYLAQLLGRYDNQLPLAAAAYNAGEGRVKGWTASAAGMPMDVWIETIPFSETRNYVKNVLAFRVVYGLLTNMPQPALASHEARVQRRT